MFQIVPSADFGPLSSSECIAEYSIDNFDLSLLPGSFENENPCSASSNVQQFLSLYCDINSSSSLLPSEYENNINSVKDLAENLLKENSNKQLYDDISFFKKDDSFLKYQNSWNGDDDIIKAYKNNIKSEDNTFLNKNSFLNMEIVEWNNKTEWNDIRIQSSVPSVSSSSSDCPSPDFQLCPATPPDFHNILSMQDTKQEITLNLQKLLADEKRKKSFSEEKKPELLRSILEKSPLNEIPVGKTKITKVNNHDYKLLREVLKDTSFQKKYNLKPFNIEGLGTCYQTETKLEDVKNKEDVCDMNLTDGINAPILSKAIEQLMQDVDNTSIMLGIPRDPKKWSVDDVGEWLLWNSKQHNLPIPMELFNVSGSTLSSMTEHDFQQRAPQCGSILFAQLEIWKVSSIEDTHLDVNTLLCDISAQSHSSADMSDEDDEEDEEMRESSSPTLSITSQNGLKIASRGSGSHIHLWQFLKELLSSPHIHGSCIRWLDRTKGVFKIEDSVRVARLWGKRKNRPAMNYDKLSRSIRQYYKKGIMKKTERSQRLVYQFCAPYNL